MSCKLLPFQPTLDNTDPAEFEEFGVYVDLSTDGTILSVGSAEYDANGNGIEENHGRIIIYKFKADRTGWEAYGTPVVADTISERITIHDLAGNGNTLVVPSLGVAKVYELNTSTMTWDRKGNTIENVEVANRRSLARFPTAVLSADGNRLAAVSDDNGIQNKVLLIFDYNASTMQWDPVSFEGPNVDDDEVSRAVAISDDGNTIMTRGRLNTTTGGSDPIFQITRRIGGQWTAAVPPSNEIVTFLSTYCTEGCAFDMASNGSVFVAAGITIEGDPTRKGLIAYEYDGTNWSQLGNILNFQRSSFEEDNESFSTVISTTGDRLAILRDAPELLYKYIEVYDLVNGVWTVQSRDDSRTDNLRVALSNNGETMAYGISTLAEGKVVYYTCAKDSDTLVDIDTTGALSEFASSKAISNVAGPGNDDKSGAPLHSQFMASVLLFLVLARSLFR